MDVVFVAMPGPGSRHRNKHNPGRLCLDRENRKKRCIISIKNKDQLCCTRAIVTMRGHCHKALHKAQELYRQAGVAEGPCGLEELRQFW